MPGLYPPDAECCVLEDADRGIECTRVVAHSFAVSGPGAIVRYYFCEHHWQAGAKDAVAAVQRGQGR